MAYVPVPKDLTKVKSKFLFGLTKRQVFCFGIGAACGLPVFFLTKGSIGITFASMLMIVIMLPFFLFAMYEQHGQPLEVVLRHIVESRFTRPRIRGRLKRESMMCFRTTSSGCPCCSYMANRKNGSIRMIIRKEARVVPIAPLVRKNTGRPQTAPMPKQMT